jgi:hypothetical protein
LEDDIKDKIDLAAIDAKNMTTYMWTLTSQLN